MTRVPSRAHGARALRIRSALALVVVAGALFVSIAPQASGDPISDKKAQAARIAARIDDLNKVIERYAEQANAAQIELDDLNAQVADSAKKVADAQAQVDQHERELRAYAVDAYVRGGDDTTAVAYTGAANPTEAGQREGYLAAASRNRQQLIDGLNATQQDLQVQIAALDQEKAAAQEKQTSLKGLQAKAQSSVNEQIALKSQTDKELAQLIAEQQAAAEAARQAAAAARAAAAAQARANASLPAAYSGPASGNAATAVNTALAQVGKPYQYGAAGPDSFDCSGLVMYAWHAAGVSLPHNTNAQYSATRHVSLNDIQPGDIIYYDSFGHDGLYIGNGKIVHAPHTGAFVEVVSLYYVGDPIAASRP